MLSSPKARYTNVGTTASQCNPLLGLKIHPNTKRAHHGAFGAQAATTGEEHWHRPSSVVWASPLASRPYKLSPHGAAEGTAGGLADEPADEPADGPADGPAV